MGSRSHRRTFVVSKCVFHDKVDLDFKNTKVRWAMRAFLSSPIVCLGKCFFLGGALGMLRGPGMRVKPAPLPSAP